MQVLELARCEWIDRRENVIALGPSGTGKTHVALGLGLAVCQKGLSVGFITAAALVHELMEARDERRLLRLQKQMANCKLLIIDELGFVPLSKTGAELLFELISQRYERGATLITSNLPFDEWTETFGSERLTGALLDRLTHHVNILEMNGDSYRLAQSRGRKGIAINQGQDRLALAGQSAQAPASYIESAGTWAPSAFLVPDSGTLKWPTLVANICSATWPVFAPPLTRHDRLRCRKCHYSYPAAVQRNIPKADVHAGLNSIYRNRFSVCVIVKYGFHCLSGSRFSTKSAFPLPDGVRELIGQNVIREVSSVLLQPDMTGLIRLRPEGR